MARRLSNDEFIEKIIEIHGHKFDYSQISYENIRTDIILICRIHGEFKIKPYNALIGQGCNRCARQKHKLLSISPERLKKLKEVHQNKYQYNNLDVIDGKIIITCPIHGSFKQSIHHHEYGHGCSECSLSERKRVKKRVCRTCKNEKNVSSFAPRFKTCNECTSKKSEINKKKCIMCGKTKNTSDFAKRKDSTDGLLSKCKECNSTYRQPINKTYRNKNKQSIRKKDLKYRKTRIQTDDLYRAKLIAREVIRKAIARGGYKKNSRTEQILGCDFETFKNHIECNFKEGMTWQNRSEWHIDHIIPISLATSENHLIELNHYTNLQPLWGYENIMKSDKIIQ